MRIRAVDADGDRVFGHGQADLIQNKPEGVGLLVQARLGLWTGDWFLNLDDGMPYRTEVLGRRTEASRDPAIRNRILDTQGVTAIADYAAQQNRATRALTVQATLNTTYGQTLVATPISTVIEDVRLGR